MLVSINIGESGFMSKIEFYLLVAIEVRMLLREGVLAVEIILLQIALIDNFCLFTILKWEIGYLTFFSWRKQGLVVNCRNWRWTLLHQGLRGRRRGRRLFLTPNTVIVSAEATFRRFWLWISLKDLLSVQKRISALKNSSNWTCCVCLRRRSSIWRWPWLGIGGNWSRIKELFLCRVMERFPWRRPRGRRWCFWSVG